MDFSAVANEIAKWPAVKEPGRYFMMYWPIICIGGYALYSIGSGVIKGLREEKRIKAEKNNGPT